MIFRVSASVIETSIETSYFLKHPRMTTSVDIYFEERDTYKTVITISAGREWLSEVFS